MARFNFSMSGLLGLRERIEDQKKQEFGNATLELEHQKGILKDLTDQKNESVQLFKQSVSEQIDPYKNIQYNNYIKFTGERIDSQKQNVRSAEVFLKKKHGELIESTKEKKKIEKLKERKFEQYIIDEKKSEQAGNDEVVSYRYNK